MTPEIEKFILDHTSTNVGVISKEVQGKYGKFLPPTAVSKILARRTRSDNVSKAKNTLSSTLDDKVEIIEHVTARLLAMFDAETAVTKDKIEAAKELRQWVKASTDLAGIHDEETDTVFVIDGAWDVTPSGKPN